MSWGQGQSDLGPGHRLGALSQIPTAISISMSGADIEQPNENGGCEETKELAKDALRASRSVNGGGGGQSGVLTIRRTT